MEVKYQSQDKIRENLLRQYLKEHPDAYVYVGDEYIPIRSELFNFSTVITTIKYHSNHLLGISTYCDKPVIMLSGYTKRSFTLLFDQLTSGSRPNFNNNIGHLKGSILTGNSDLTDIEIEYILLADYLTGGVSNDMKTLLNEISFHQQTYFQISKHNINLLSYVHDCISHDNVKSFVEMFIHEYEMVTKISDLNYNHDLPHIQDVMNFNNFKDSLKTFDIIVISVDNRTTDAFNNFFNIDDNNRSDVIYSLSKETSNIDKYNRLPFVFDRNYQQKVVNQRRNVIYDVGGIKNCRYLYNPTSVDCNIDHRSKYGCYFTIDDKNPIIYQCLKLFVPYQCGYECNTDHYHSHGN